MPMPVEPLMVPSEVTGRGDTVVLVPGGLTGWVSWRPHAERLASSRRVMRVQLLSVERGLSGMPLPPAYSVTTERQALTRTIEHAGITRADFAGWSYGAEILLDFALTYPHRIRTLTLIEPPAFWVLRSRGPLSPEALQFQRVTQTFGPDDVTEDQLVQFTRFAGFVPADRAPQSMPQWPQWVAHRQSLRTGDFAFRHDDDITRVRQFDRPVLLFKGEGSRSYLTGIINVLGEEFSTAHVRELPGAHALHLISLDAFMEIFTEFLNTPQD